MLALLTLLLVAVATYISVVFGTATIRLVAVVLPAFSVAVWSAGVSLNHNNSVFPRGPGSGSYVLLRYGAVPSMCLIASIVLAVATPWPRKRLRQVCAGAVAIALAVTALASFVPQGTRRALGPVWSTEAADARKSCDGAPPTTVQKIATAPAGWTIKLSCGVLRR